MLNTLSRNWWLIVLRGVFAILFGAAALAWPEATIYILVLLFGAYTFVDGIILMFTSITDRDNASHRWLALLEGLAGVVIGILAMIWPNVTALVLITFVAAWAIITGILEIMVALQLRQELDGEWALVLSGILSIVLGALLVINPGAGFIALVWMIGIYAILFGTLLIYLGFQVKGIDSQTVLNV